MLSFFNFIRMKCENIFSAGIDIFDITLIPGNCHVTIEITAEIISGTDNEFIASVYVAPFTVLFYFCRLTAKAACLHILHSITVFPLGSIYPYLPFFMTEARPDSKNLTLNTIYPKVGKEFQNFFYREQVDNFLLS